MERTPRIGSIRRQFPKLDRLKLDLKHMEERSMAKPRIVGMMTVYNEADILEQAVRYSNQQGIPLVIVDDGSTDGSKEIEHQLLGNGVLEVNNFHEAYSGKVFQKGLQAYDFALKHSPDWVVSLSADEI